MQSISSANRPGLHMRHLAKSHAYHIPQQADQPRILSPSQELHGLARVWSILGGILPMPNTKTINPMADLRTIHTEIRRTLHHLEELRQQGGSPSLVKTTALQQAEALIQQYYVTDAIAAYQRHR